MENILSKSDALTRTTRDTSSENAVKTLQWLLKSVSNLKADVNSINQNFNFTKTLQNSEELQKQMNLLQVLKYVPFTSKFYKQFQCFSIQRLGRNPSVATPVHGGKGRTAANGRGSRSAAYRFKRFHGESPTLLERYD